MPKCQEEKPGRQIKLNPKKRKYRNVSVEQVQRAYKEERKREFDDEPDIAVKLKVIEKNESLDKIDPRKLSEVMNSYGHFCKPIEKLVFLRKEKPL